MSKRYQKIKVHGKLVFKHLYVWEQFHGKRRLGYHIHHLDGNTSNNSITNLVELQEDYHYMYHKLATILNLTMRKFNIMLGMRPEDSPVFYNKLTELSKQYNITKDSAAFKIRKKNGSGLDKTEAIKKRMIITGKKCLLEHKDPWQRNSNAATETCKKTVVKYFGTLQNYKMACEKK